MKSLIMLVVLVSAFAAYSATIMPGAALGLNIANVSIKDADGNAATGDNAMDSKMGFVGGAIVDIGINDMISIIPGLEFNMKGAKKVVSPVTASVNFNYLTIPIMVAAKFNAGSVKPFVMVGPEIGILMSANYKIEGVPAPADAMNGTTDIKSDMASTDFDLNFGAGAEMEMGSLTPFIQVMYSLGLSNLEKTPVQSSSEKTNGILIQLGAKFKM
jgi:hypothetical protein